MFTCVNGAIPTRITSRLKNAKNRVRFKDGFKSVKARNRIKPKKQV